MSYELSQKELTRLRSRLTRAKKTENPTKILAEVRYAESIFDAKGWPDCWSTWEIAKRDAEFQILRSRW